MLLGIPGDNTYANYQEANRAFWRGTVLPLVGRIAGALGNWLAPAFAGAGGGREQALRLWYDADQIDALSADREALWARVASADFLTVNEKRAAVGYGEVEGGDATKSLRTPARTLPDFERRYNPKWHLQLRVPAGSGEESGRWTDGGATGGVDASEAEPAERPIQLAINGDGIPKIPIERPPSQSARWRIVREVVRGLVRASPAGRILDVIEVGSWVYEYAPYVQAYFDSPKSLDELRASVGQGRRGYNDHHIVEKTPALRDGLDPARVLGGENIVSIPQLMHWRITGWFATRNDEFGGLSPRDYLRGKDFETRFRIGESALRRYGVLEP